MVLLKAPLASQEAHGTLADVLTFSKRRGRHVAGVSSRPKQPRTEAQRATRIFMAWLTSEWKGISSADQATWLNYADTPLLSPYHAYVRHNVNRFKLIPGLASGVSVKPIWPGQSYPVTLSGLYDFHGGIVITPGVGYLDFKRDIWILNEQWGYAYFRRSTEHYYPCYRNLVAIETVQTGTTRTTRIENLPAGPIFIYYQQFTTDGFARNDYGTISTTIL